MSRLPTRNLLPRRNGTPRDLGSAARRILRSGGAAHVALLFLDAGARKVIHELFQVTSHRVYILRFHFLLRNSFQIGMADER